MTVPTVEFETLNVSLRHAGTAVHEPAAWFIAGDDPVVWLEEMSHWAISLSSARLYPLPTSVRDPRPCGALIVFLDNKIPRAELLARAEAYGCLAGKLYLPVAAHFHPGATVDELRSLLPFDLGVFHPAAGLIGFNLADGLTAAALLTRPTRRRAVWTRARHGAAPHARLVSVEPEAVLSIQELIENARGDIGTHQLHLPDDSGEKSPQESPGILERLAAGMTRLFSSLTGGKSAEPGAPQQTESLAGKQDKEIKRLLEMLEKNPDEGLRYAINLGDSGTRGVAPSSGKLAPHDVDFLLKRTRGGGVAEYWPIPPDVQNQLRKKYIDAANRELSLGRHRRAAYIFAELLADHTSAASALRQGRHFREAAALYRDTLKNKVMAAECLESGGLITEAVAIREELSHWIDAARLYGILERPDAARVALRRAVDAELGQKNRLGAAKILVEGLNDSERALEVLASGWPDSAQAKACLEHRFALLGRIGQHSEAGKLIQNLRAEKLSAEQSRFAISVLAKTSAVYPHAACRSKAADVARILTGVQLRRVTVDHVRELTDCVAALAPEDRVLARDASRYLSQRTAAGRAAAKPATGKKPALKKRFKLPGAVWKMAASATGSDFFAVGIKTSGEASFLRGLWNGTMQERGWPVRPRHPIRIEPPRLPWQPVLAAVLSGEYAQTLGMRQLAETEDFPERTSVGTPAWLPDQSAGFCYDEHGAMYAVSVRQGDATLSRFGSNAMLLAQFLMEPLAKNRAADWLPMAARNESVFVSNGGDRLNILYRSKLSTLEMPNPIFALAVTTPFTRLRVAVSLDEGGVLMWPTPPQRLMRCNFGEGMARPMVAFTRGGALIAATKEEIRIYSTENENLRILANSPGPGKNPIAVVPAEGLNEYALFLENGEVLVQQAPDG